MNFSTTLAWRYLGTRKLRTLLTTSAIAFGVLIIFGMNLLLPTMLEALKANMMAASGAVDVTITHISGSGFPQQVARRLENIPGIRAYAVSLERTINLPPDFVDGDPHRQDRISAINLVGIEPKAAQSLQAYLVNKGGRFLEEGDRNAAVISQSLADAWGVRVGDSIRLPSVEGLTQLTIVGLLPPRTMPGNEEVLVTLAQAQAMTGQPEQINAIRIALTSLDQAVRDQTLAAIQANLGNDYQIGTLAPGSEMFASIKLAQAAMNMFGVIALFMGGFIIFNTFRAITAERRHDIGMLRALGATRSTIRNLILVEGLLQGGIGSSIGIVLGYLFWVLLLRLAEPSMKTFINLEFGKPVVSPALVITSILLGVGVTVLATLLPAHDASRITPLQALRPSLAEVEYRRRAGVSFFVGLVWIGLALLGLLSGEMSLIALASLIFLLGLILIMPALLHPIAGGLSHLLSWFYAHRGIAELARGNLTRQPRRVTVTASATMIGLAIVVALGAMTSSLGDVMENLIRKTLGSDYLFIPPSIAVWNSDLGASPEFAARLRKIEGVEAVSTLRFASTAVKGKPVSLLGIDPKTFPQVSALYFQHGNEAMAYQALASGRAAIVNGPFLMTLGAKVGDTVEFSTPNGPRAYTIVAQASDLLNAKVVTAYISQENLAADFGRTDDIFIQLNLRPGVKAEQVDAAIRAVAAAYPQFTILNSKQYIDQLLQMTQAMFAGMYVLFTFLALPALIAMVNTLVISVIERRREIGLIRAVGATRSQVQRLITTEALLLASVGAMFGILAGMYLGYVIVKGLEVMFPLPYTFPIWGILMAIVIGLLFGALAALVPARQAAQLPVVEAIRYE